MSEPATGSANPDLPAGPVLTTNGAASSDVSATSGLQVGQRWRDLKIETTLPDIGDAESYLADHVGLMQKVAVRATRITDATDWRRRSWEQLRALPESRIVACLEAHEEGGWRYEVTAAPPPTSLRDWIACHRPSSADIIGFVRQLAAMLGNLHAQGLVHLNLRPESIHVDDSGAEPIYLLGGLHAATLLDQPELVAVEVDPRYAPPEAAGLARHSAGAGMCAWDWWSLGRVVQEFQLGRHVLGLILDRDVSRLTPEIAGRAELLLLEREPTGVRAGALDYMPEDPVVMPLLRGLLTSSMEARWGGDAIQRWLRREPVKDHYDLPRNARLWSWRGRGFTVAEAAEFFTKGENWDVGEDMLFQTEEPGSLASFLKEVPAQRADWERLSAVCELAESAAWQDVPVVVRRTVTAAVSWLSLGVGAGGRAEFRVRGQTIDLPGLSALMELSGPEKGIALFRALTASPVIQFVESLDGPAARTLRTMAANAGRALQLVLAHGWVDRDDAVDQARLLSLAFVSGSVLRERMDLLRATYATNANPMLAQIMTGKTPQTADLIALVHLAQSPEKSGFITHDSWRRQRCAALQADGEQIVTRLLWLRLSRLLATSRLWGTSSTLFAAAVLVLTALVGWFSRRFELTALVAIVLLLSRLWLWWRLKRMISRFDRTAPAWAWSDGYARASAAAKKILDAAPETAGELQRKLRGVRQAMAEIVADQTKRPRVGEPQWWDLWLCIGSATALTLVILVMPLAERRAIVTQQHQPAKGMPTVVAAPTKAVPPPVLAALNGGIVKDPEALLATGRYEILDDGFGRRLRGPLKTWDRRPPAQIADAEVDVRADASPEQTAYAMVSGGLLLEPYGRKAVRVLLALRVPTTRGFGIVIYNARDRQLYDRRVHLLHSALTNNTWYRLGRYHVLYLESPLPAAATISLAPL